VKGRYVSVLTVDGKPAQAVLDAIRAACAGQDALALDEAVLAALAAARPTPTPAPNPAPAGFRLVDSDDFLTTAVDAKRWSIYGPAVGNEGVGWRAQRQTVAAAGELQIVGIPWSADFEVEVAGYIAAQAKEKKPVSAAAQALLRAGVGGGVSHKINQTFGRWEVRARMDKGAGNGPALLLWPKRDKDWPGAGEIDIMECPKGDRAQAVQTLHFGQSNEQIGKGTKLDVSQWHTYVVEWLPDRITWLIDGVITHEVQQADVIPRGPMHLAIQNDVGAKGHWIEARNASSPAVIALHVDWVKVYERVPS
jgi:hypothetical protein